MYRIIIALEHFTFVLKMLKILLYSIVTLSFSIPNTIAQKRVIDSVAIQNWEYVSQPIFSRDGRYCMYTWTKGEEVRLVLKDILQNREKIFSNVGKGFFTKDQRNFAVGKTSNTIETYSLPDFKLLSTIAGRNLSGDDQSSTSYLSWAVDSNNTVSTKVLNCITKKVLNINTDQITFDPINKEALYAVQENNRYAFIRHYLLKDVKVRIWTGQTKPSKTLLSKNNKDFVILGESDYKTKALSLYLGNQKELIDISEILKNAYPDFELSRNLVAFNNQGDKLMIALSRSLNNHEYPAAVKPNVDIWNYNDLRLKEQQLEDLSNPTEEFSYCYIDVKTRTLHKITKSKDEIICDWPSLLNTKGHLLVTKRSGPTPRYLRIDARELWTDTLLVRELSTGKDFLVASGEIVNNFGLSPGGNYVVYFSQNNRSYYLYDIIKKESNTINVKQLELVHDIKNSNRKIFEPASIVGWGKGDKSVLLSDGNDIWQIEVEDQSKVKCLTFGLGKKYRSSVNFRLDNRIFEPNKDVLFFITGDDMKERYFFGIPSKILNDSCFSLQPYHYAVVERRNDDFLVLRSDGVKQFNWFLTKDLMTFNAVTDIKPEENWNWHTKKMIRFELPDGRLSKALVYLPENLDTAKKYPVIVNLYEKHSQKRYEQATPDYSGGPIDPAWMCSRGYIILEPDIEFRFGSPGQDAYQTTIAAVDELSKYPWVDSTKIGLSGGSHGAYAINYIVTRTNRFKAAAPAFGMVDLISGYLSLRGKGVSREYIYETGQGKIGPTLWENQQLYIDNSPIFKADQVSTPILILHNKGDDAVPWFQGVEWFLALRRNAKKVWMLQYDGEGHGISEKNNLFDYTCKLEDFFAHYLKSGQEPSWMKSGIPALKKVR